MQDQDGQNNNMIYFILVFFFFNGITAQIGHWSPLSSSSTWIYPTMLFSVFSIQKHCIHPFILWSTNWSLATYPPFHSSPGYILWFSILCPIFVVLNVKPQQYLHIGLKIPRYILPPSHAESAKHHFIYFNIISAYK